jgi:GNAT superfamily N-acetyltransferase
MADPEKEIVVRNTMPQDIDAVIALCRKVYPGSNPWTAEQLQSHQRVFPEGQLVAVAGEDEIAGMAASLIVWWDEYDQLDNWREFTDRGYFTNHDPEKGKTLYGAEVMVDPDRQGRGIGKKLYVARRELCQRLKLKRIRAGARLRGYHHHADKMSAAEYVQRVIRGELGDPTLSFQLKEGFDVLGVVRGYLHQDPESLGWAALIEWANPQCITPADLAGRNPDFVRPNKSS